MSALRVADATIQPGKARWLPSEHYAGGSFLVRVVDQRALDDLAIGKNTVRMLQKQAYRVSRPRTVVKPYRRRSYGRIIRTVQYRAVVIVDLRNPAPHPPTRMELEAALGNDRSLIDQILHRKGRLRIIRKPPGEVVSQFSAPVVTKLP